MAINFKVIKKTQPGVAGGGNQKYYAAIKFNGEVSIDDLVKDIEKFSALSEPDIRGVIIALENVIQNKLGESKIVRLDKLGSFYPTLHSDGKDSEEELNAKSIKSIGVNYRAGERIIEAMRSAGFKKVSK